MAWTTPRTWTTGELVTASIMNAHVRDNLSYLKGDAGAVTIASAVSVPDYFRVTDASGNKRLVLGNTGGSGANNPGIIESSNGSLRLGGGDSWTTDGGTFTATMQVGDGLGVYIGDTSNAKMTQGLTINQGASDDNILDLKSTDVGHAMTDLAEADTFAHFIKQSPTGGGLRLVGFVDGDSSVEPALNLHGYVTSAPDTTKSTAGKGAVQIVAALSSGAGVTTIGANGNLLMVGSHTTARFILDADGDSHQDVGTAWTNFDSHDDAALLTELSVHVSRPDDSIRQELGEFLQTNRARLEALRLVTFNDDGHHFVNMSRLTMLLVGAVRQVSSRLDSVLGRLENVERKLLAA